MKYRIIVYEGKSKNLSPGKESRYMVKNGTQINSEDHSGEHGQKLVSP